MTKAICFNYSPNQLLTGQQCSLRSFKEREHNLLEKETLKPYLKPWKESKKTEELYNKYFGIDYISTFWGVGGSGIKEWIPKCKYLR